MFKTTENPYPTSNVNYSQPPSPGNQIRDFVGRYQVNSISKIKEQLLNMPRGSWILWDLDDTVFIPILPLLRTVNVALLENYLETQKVQYPNIRQLLWELYDCCEYKLVEEKEILQLFLDLKEKEIHVLSLTKRRTGYATSWQLEKKLSHEDLTLSQLSKLGITFSSVFSESEIILMESELGDPDKKLELFSFEYQGPAKIKSGVIFTSKLEKGFIAKLVLQKATELGIPRPPAIGFVDDLKENADNAEAVFNEIGIESLIIHYTAANDLYDNCHIDTHALNREIERLHEMKNRG